MEGEGNSISLAACIISVAGYGNMLLGEEYGREDCARAKGGRLCEKWEEKYIISP